LANSIAAVVRHQKVRARHRKCDRKIQSSDQAGLDRDSRGGVEFADRASAIGHEKKVARQSESQGFIQPGDEVGVDHGPRRSAVFANCAVPVIYHKKGIARQSEFDGIVQSPDEVEVNGCSRCGVVLAHRVARFVRHEQVVARQRESVDRPPDKVAVDHSSRRRVEFGNAQITADLAYVERWCRSWSGDCHGNGAEPRCERRTRDRFQRPVRCDTVY
jgi:hypothetical protein